ncbi:MFS transporter [Mannheimia massilioguelmaensis]|uniref:MFS transporter n=1 Tax=Mannheimia massilioguelmaensis TaxID=1604354 RepID=UPI0005C9277D|nr:MFS transporter [Mannheimia massilioguelmaensis]
MATSVYSSTGKFNFGSRGWLVIIVQACVYWVGAGILTHGLNVTLPELSKFYHLDYNEMLFFVTPASWAAIPAAPIFAWLCNKKGIKFNQMFCLIMSIISYGLLGYCDSIAKFTLAYAAVSFFGTGFTYIGGTALVASWFVKKQSLALGFTSFGQTFSSSLFVPILALSFSIVGVQHGFWIMSAIMLVILVVITLFVAGKPEDVGLLPDNEQPTAEILKTLATQETTQEDLGLTASKLLKMKDVWFMGISTGAIYIMLVGVISQIVPRLIEIGLSPEVAISYMSISALVGGLFGAYGWGWINHKLGIKRALLIYTLWWMMALALNIANSQTLLLVSMGMIGLALPGATNYSTSFIATKFPRAAYIKALGVIHPIQSIIRCCAFSILALGLTYLGGYAGAYMLLILIGALTLVIIWFTNLTPYQAKQNQ